MGRFTRYNPTQQFQAAPTDKQYAMISDPNDGGKYKHVAVDTIQKPTEVTLASNTITSAEVTADSKVFTVTAPATGYAPAKAVADINGKWNVGTVQSIAAGQNAGEYTITVTDFADESMEDDELGLTIYWSYSPN